MNQASSSSSSKGKRVNTVPILSSSGSQMGGIDAPITSIQAIKYCSRCDNLHRQDQELARKIVSLERDYREQKHDSDRHIERLTYSEAFWKKKYLELYKRLCKVIRCQRCRSKNFFCVTLLCGHIVCRDCIRTAMEGAEEGLDALPCPIPAPSPAELDAATEAAAQEILEGSEDELDYAIRLLRSPRPDQHLTTTCERREGALLTDWAKLHPLQIHSYLRDLAELEVVSQDNSEYYDTHPYEIGRLNLRSILLHE